MYCSRFARLLHLGELLLGDAQVAQGVGEALDALADAAVEPPGSSVSSPETDTGLLRVDEVRGDRTRAGPRSS